MIEISETMARYFFNGNICSVYIVYPDGTERMVEDIADIQTRHSDCVLGREENE